MDTTVDAGRGLVEKTLSHVGVKGMRWGVRRKDPSGSDSPDIKIKSKAGKGIVKVSGGGGRHASDDAVKAAVYKQKAKTSSVDSLNNDELKALINRMTLEQQYSKLTRTPGRLERGQKATKTLLSVGTTVNEVVAFASTPTGKAIRKKLTK